MLFWFKILLQMPLLHLDSALVGYLDCSSSFCSEWRPQAIFVERTSSLGYVNFRGMISLPKHTSWEARIYWITIRRSVANLSNPKFHQHWLSFGLSLLPWGWRQQEKIRQENCHQYVLYHTIIIMLLDMRLSWLGRWGRNVSLPVEVLGSVSLCKWKLLGCPQSRQQCQMVSLTDHPFEVINHLYPVF